MFIKSGAQDLSIFKIFAPTLIASRSADGKCRLEGIASSTVRDHHGDAMTVKALEKMAQSARGMTIFLNHSYNVPQDVFGRVEKVALKRSGEIDPRTKSEIYDLRFGIVVTKSNPVAMQTFEQIEDGAKLGLSIGAMVPEGGAIFDKSDGGRYLVDDVELVETSIVGVPANPRSWIDYAVKSLAGKYPEKLDKERAALAEVMEAEGVTVVTEEQPEVVAEQGLDDTEVAEEAGEDDPAVEHTAPDVNDSASNDQEDPDGADATVPVNDNDPTPSEDGAEAAPADSATKTRVTVWDNDKVVEIDTGRSKPKSDGDQSAQAEPENAGGPTALEATTKAGDDEIVLNGAVEVTLQNSRQMIANLSAQLKASRAETDEVRQELAAVMEVARKAVDGTAAIIAQLSELPVGRKAGFVEAEKSFTTLREDIYGPDVQKLLMKGSST
jgi:phage head maturation protease